MSDDHERFCVDLDTWMRDRIQSGEYPDLGAALVTGWTMFLDRFDPADEDNDWSWTVLHPPGQSVALSVGHGHLIAQIKGEIE
jgi:hypothetical protein